MARLRKHTDKYRKKLLTTARNATAGLSGMVVMRTAVDTGTARASWNATIGAPVAKNVYVNKDNPYAVRNKISEVINRLMPGDSFFLTNGLPYIRPLEYEGHSAQSPAGMLRISVAQWQQIVDEAARGA